MTEDLQNEIEAINSIYGEGTLGIASGEDIYVLHLPQDSTSLKIRFPFDYPTTRPAVLGTESSGEYTRKGEAAQTVDVFRKVLEELYQPGEVCLFDVIEEFHSRFSSAKQDIIEEEQPDERALVKNLEDRGLHEEPGRDTIEEEPPWVVSDVILELKSTFVARSAPVFTPVQATKYLQHLLNSDKKVRSATHNITAWRIRGENNVTYQDCDDDGESAAGGRVLHLMQLMDIWNVMVIVTRWYGGHHLGPKRFSIINTVARDAFVKGGFLKDEPATKKRGKH